MKAKARRAYSKTIWKEWIKEWEEKGGKDAVLAGRSRKMNWVGEMSECWSHTDSAALKERPSDVRNDSAHSGEHATRIPMSAIYIYVTGASRVSKWEEQSRPQQACPPPMFSLHSDGHSEQLQCTSLWATCFSLNSSWNRFWIFQNSSEMMQTAPK